MEHWHKYYWSQKSFLSIHIAFILQLLRDAFKHWLTFNVIVVEVVVIVVEVVVVVVEVVVVVVEVVVAEVVVVVMVDVVVVVVVEVVVSLVNLAQQSTLSF